MDNHQSCGLYRGLHIGSLAVIVSNIKRVFNTVRDSANYSVTVGQRLRMLRGSSVRALKHWRCIIKDHLQ